MKSPTLPYDLTALASQADGALSVRLREQIEDAGEFAKRSVPPNTVRAYQADWRHFEAWCQQMHIAPDVPNPEFVAAYLSGMATGMRGDNRTYAVATIERRLAALCWRYRMMGAPLAREDGRISAVLRGIRRAILKKPAAKEPVLTEDLIRMLDTLPPVRLRNVRDRAILLLGFAGGLRRSELVGLDVGQEQSLRDPAHKGWVEFLDGGILLFVRNKGDVLREIEVAEGSQNFTCPVFSLRKWMELGRIVHGPIFRPIVGRSEVSGERLRDAAVAEIVKKAVVKAGVGAHLNRPDPQSAYAGHSLRSGFASSAEIDEGKVQRQLGHASSDMTRRYQRHRQRFKTNLTKATGL